MSNKKKEEMATMVAESRDSKFKEEVGFDEQTEHLKNFKGAIEEDAKAKSEEEVEEEKPKYNSIKEFVASPEEKIHALKLAEDIKSIVSSNWFDMKKYCKKTRRGASEAYLQLNVLIEFGFLAVKNEGRLQYYKIDLDLSSQLVLVDADIVTAEGNVKALKAKKKKLKARQKELSKDLDVKNVISSTKKKQ